MKNKKNCIRKYIQIFLSICIVMLINLSYSTEKVKINLGDVNMLNSFLQIIGINYIIGIIWKKEKGKKLMFFSGILGLIFTLMAIPKMIDLVNVLTTLQNIPKSYILYSVLKFIGVYVLITSLVMRIFKFLDKKMNEENNTNKSELIEKIEKYFLGKGWISVIIIAIIISLLYLPYLFNYYPGGVPRDIVGQLEETFNGTYRNLHPFVHTLIMGNSVKFVYGITNNINFSIALITMIEIFIFGIVCGLVIRKLAQYNVKFELKMVTFLFFALFPIFPQITLYIWKDTLFGILVMLFILELVDILLENQKYGKEKKGKIYNICYSIYLAFLILMVMFIRHNGYYVMLLTAPIAILTLWKNKFRILLIFIIPIILYNIITGPVYNTILHVHPYSEGEKYSIPRQAMARIGKYRDHDVTEEDRNAMKKFMQYDKAREKYIPWISDNAKFGSNGEALKKETKEFISLYLRLFAKFPKESILALLEQTEGYYSPESKVIDNTPEGKANFEMIQAKNWEKLPLIEQRRIIDIPAMNKMFLTIHNKNVMVVSWLTSIGLAVWSILLTLWYIIYIKKYRYILAYVPILLLWLTCIASPVSGDTRYIFPVFCTLPLYLLLPILIRNNNQMLEVEEVEKEEK